MKNKEIDLTHNNSGSISTEHMQVLSLRASLTIQLLLTPADATLQFNITITLSVSSGSATGTVHEQLEITPT